MQTQTDNALYIKRRKAHYIFQVKGNQDSLLKTCKSHFSEITDWDYQQTDKGHGKLITRYIKCYKITKLDRKQIHFPYSGQIICVKREQTVITTGEITTENSYYITSLDSESEILFKNIREHWHIENKLHYVRDVTFREDHSQVRTGSSPRVMATLRNLVISILRLLGITNIAKGLRKFSRNRQLLMELLT